MKQLVWLGVCLSLASLVVRLPLVQITAGLCAGLALLVAWRRSRDDAAFVLGLLLPTLPLVGSGTLLLAVGLLSIGVWPTVSPRLLVPWAPFLGVALVAVTVQGLADGLAMGGTALLGDPSEGWKSLLRLRELVRMAPPVLFSTGEEWLRLALIAIGFAVWHRIPSTFARGLLWGLMAAAAVTTAELLHAMPIALPNQNAFWLELHRPVGSFTDPNSMGIFLVLALPYLWWRRRELGPLATWGVLLWGGLGVFSGSRSYVVGVVLLLAIELYRWSPRACRIGIASGALFLLTLNLLHEAAPDRIDRGLALLPSSLERVCQTLVVSRMPEAFSSRLIFWEISTRIWLDAPGFGVGFGRIRELVPAYALDVAPHIGMYTDNANNFYLGVLAEMGIVGVLALLWLVAGLRAERGESRIAQLVSIFGVLLLFGPHVAFDEVAVLLSVMLAEGFGVRTLPSRALSLAPVLLGLGAAVAFLVGDWGLYAAEQEGPAVRRWTMQRAQVWLTCDDAGHANLTMRAIQPGLTADPLRVAISTSSGVTVARSISDNQWATTVVTCQPRRSRVRVRLVASRAWIPKEVGVGGDSRVLGVQLELPRRR